MGSVTDMCGDFDDCSEEEECQQDSVVREGCLPEVGDFPSSSPAVADELGLVDGPERTACYIAPPQEPKQYMDALAKALTKNEGNEWKKLYHAELESFGGHGSASPSFFLNSARVLVKHGKACDAVRIATNCHEAGIDDVQMLRSVGYVLLSAETSDGLDLSIEVFDKVQELEPCEPQSFVDSGLARFWKSWKVFSSVDSDEVHTASKVDDIVEGLRRDITTAQERFVHVLTHAWALRFKEVEWPVMILLHYITELLEDINKSNLPLTLTEWPSELDVFKAGLTVRDASTYPLRCNGFVQP
jgi:hypothetical protein